MSAGIGGVTVVEQQRQAFAAKKKRMQQKHQDPKEMQNFVAQKIAAMKKGEFVMVHGRSIQFDHYHSMTWVIDEVPFQERVVLRSSVQESKLIRVSVGKVWPVALTVVPESQGVRP